MESLLKWCTSIKLEVEIDEGKNIDHLFFSERINYSSCFIGITPPDEVTETIKALNATVYTLYAEATFISGQPSWSSTWRWTPEPCALRIGFAGTDYNELLARVTKWFEDNTDTEKEPCMVPYSSVKRLVQPVIARTKTHPHWKDDK